MKKNFLKFLSLLIFFGFNPSEAFAHLNPVSVTPPVAAESNANLHNQRGLTYFNEGDYYAALKEFKIALSINPNTQSTAVYYNNLGKVYLIFGEIQKKHKLSTANGGDFSQMARVCFENAITQDCMKFEYYKNLIKAYEVLGVTNQKKAFLSQNMSKNPFNAIPVAIIMVNQGQKASALMLLEDFAEKNPDLIITDDVKKYIKSLLE